MPARLLKSIKKALRTFLDWDYIKKSQAVLIYATLIEGGLYYLQIKYLYHPFINTEFLLKFMWFFPTIIFINALLFILGFALKRKLYWHYSYGFVVGLFYSISLMMLPVVVGILNIANGVIFVGTTLISLILFPRKIVYIAMSACAVIYIVAAVLTVNGYMDYALALKPHVLIHPDIENIYITASMFYTVLYSALTIYLFDICLRNWQEKELYKDKLSCTDELTDLLNRRGVNEMIDLQIQQARITHKETSLIVVDVDNFKSINDQYGHQQGDVVLKHVANVLRDNLRTSDIIGRYGGEEFVILLPFTSIDNAMLVAEVCREALEQSAIEVRDGEQIYVKASFGVSSTATSDFDYSELFEQADKALYRAKNSGKNQVRTV